MITQHPFILWPYFFMIFVGLMVPSDGEHGLLSLKSLSFLAANAALGGYIFVKQRMNAAQLKLALFFCGSICLLLLWLFVSLIHDETTGGAQLDQFKLFVITLSFPIATLYLISEGLITPQHVFKAVIYASFTYALLKVVLVALHLLKILDVWSFINFLGIRYMRMDIYGGLERVQTSADIATPFIIFFALNAKRLGVVFSRFFINSYVIVSLLSTFLSFSRYLIFVYLLSCCLYWFTYNWKGIVVVACCLCCTLAFGVYLIGPDTVGKIIERRIFSRDNQQSDETRVVQIQAMWEEFDRQPFLGTGIGGFAQSNIRDQASLHLYEVQWMAFLMQFGLFGIFFLLAPLALIVIKLVHAPFSRVRWSFLGAFGLWLLSGFTNPFLISLTSGIMYALYYLSAIVLQEKEQKISFRGEEDEKQNYINTTCHSI